MSSSEPSEGYSTDSELPQWFSDSDQQRHDTFDNFERRMLVLRGQLDAIPHIPPHNLQHLSKRFETLATKVRRYGFTVRDVGRDHWLFEFLELMWELAVAICVRLYGDAGIADGRPLYTRSVTSIRLWVLNAHKFANAPFLFVPRDSTPLPSNYYTYDR